MAWSEKRGRTWRVRYARPDGSLRSISGFETKTAADNKARDIETDSSRGTLRDPETSMTVGEWVEVWSDAHHASDNTWAKYRSHLRNHILPEFGEADLAEVKRMRVKRWVTRLRRHLAHSTVTNIVTLLSMIMAEAVEEDLIDTSPCRRLGLGTDYQDSGVIATPEQCRRIAARCRDHDATLIYTAAYTGMRWGELAGLQWHNVDLDTATVTIDKDQGALHEVSGRLELGPPKTPASARTLHLPGFLTMRLREHRERQPHEHVFTAADGGLLRRSNFRRRIWLPAVAGDQARDWAALMPGLKFHGLRHSHKTWLIEEGIPEVLQHQRLGHRLPGVRGVYSHVTQPMIDMMLSALQQRWENS